MPRKKLPDPKPVFSTVPFSLGPGTNRHLVKEFLQADDDNVQRLATLFRVEASPLAIQSEAISRINIAIGEYLGALNSGNWSLSERNKKGRPEQSARRRLIHTLRNVFWFFNPEELEDRSQKSGSIRRNSGRTNLLFEFLRIILRHAGIQTPRWRKGHNDDLT